MLGLNILNIIPFAKDLYYTAHTKPIKNLIENITEWCVDRANKGCFDYTYSFDGTPKHICEVKDYMDQLLIAVNHFKLRGYYLEICATRMRYINGVVNNKLQFINTDLVQIEIYISWDIKSVIKKHNNAIYDTEYGIYEERLNELLKNSGE